MSNVASSFHLTSCCCYQKLTRWFWYDVTAMNVVSGKVNVSALVKSVVSLCSSGFLIKWILGWYLCIEFKMIWKYYKIFLGWIFSPMSSQEWRIIFWVLLSELKQWGICWVISPGTGSRWARAKRGSSPRTLRSFFCSALAECFFPSLPRACSQVKDSRNSCSGVCEFYSNVFVYSL